MNLHTSSAIISRNYSNKQQVFTTRGRQLTTPTSRSSASRCWHQNIEDGGNQLPCRWRGGEGEGEGERERERERERKRERERGREREDTFLCVNIPSSVKTIDCTHLQGLVILNFPSYMNNKNTKNMIHLKTEITVHVFHNTHAHTVQCGYSCSLNQQPMLIHIHVCTLICNVQCYNINFYSFYIMGYLTLNKVYCVH